MIPGCGFCPHPDLLPSEYRVIRYIVKRLVLAVPTLLGVLVASFLIVHMVPGDPVAVVMFGANPTPEQLVEMRAQLGLDRPLHVQFFDYLRDVLRGDFGQSIQRHRPVEQEIGETSAPPSC